MDAYNVIIQSNNQKNELISKLSSFEFSIEDFQHDFSTSDLIFHIESNTQLVSVQPALEILENSDIKVISLNRFLKQLNLIQVSPEALTMSYPLDNLDAFHIIEKDLINLMTQESNSDISLSKDGKVLFDHEIYTTPALKLIYQKSILAGTSMLDEILKEKNIVLNLEEDLSTNESITISI